MVVRLYRIKILFINKISDSKQKIIPLPPKIP
jgi:hypothetical protein